MREPNAEDSIVRRSLLQQKLSPILGTVQELVSQAFATEKLAQETMKLWRSDSYSDKEFAIRELELKFDENNPITL